MRDMDKQGAARRTGSIAAHAIGNNPLKAIPGTTIQVWRLWEKVGRDCFSAQSIGKDVASIWETRRVTFGGYDGVDCP